MSPDSKTLVSIKIYFETANHARAKGMKHQSAKVEDSVIPRLGVRGYAGMPQKFFLNFTCKSVHFGAFWRRFGVKRYSRHSIFYWGNRPSPDIGAAAVK